MTRFRQLPNLGSSFSHYSRCEFTGNGRDPYLVGLEGCQIWAPLRGGKSGFGSDFVKIHTESRGQSRVTSAAGVPSRMDGPRNGSLREYVAHARLQNVDFCAIERCGPASALRDLACLTGALTVTH